MVAINHQVVIIPHPRITHPPAMQAGRAATQAVTADLHPQDLPLKTTL